MEMTTEVIWQLYLENQKALTKAARITHFQLLHGKSAANVYGHEDLLHEALVKIQRKPEQLRYNLDNPGAALIRLMYTAMRTISYDILAKVKREDIDADDNLLLALDQATARALPVEEAELEASQLREVRLYASLEELANKHPKEAIVLSYGLDIDPKLDEKSGRHRRMAAELGVSHTCYRQQRHKGIKYLRNILNS